MKKLFYVCFLLLGSVSLYAAETISSVSFNPSRMGEYTYLKVADKATLKGGLKTPQLNVSVGGTVSVYPDTSSRVYGINQVNGQVQTAIEMENTVFHGNNVNQYAGYKSETNSTPSGLLNTMSIYGGDQEYTQDSYIRTLDAVNILRQRVGTLKSGRLSIGGDNGRALSLYEGDSTYGFYLAGNDIPEPTASHTNTGAELSNCTLAWEKRKTSDSPSQEVWLLALKDCKEEGGGIGPVIPPIDPPDKTYVWKLIKNPSSWTANKVRLCSSNCRENSYVGNIASSVPASERPAGSLASFSGTCGPKTVGTICKMGDIFVSDHPGQPGGGYTRYCPEYQCVAK